MRHLSTIQKEFAKHATKWDNLSYEVQKDYLLKHPNTDRRITAKPTDMSSWLRGKKFINLQTRKPAAFDELPAEQQESMKKQFEAEQAKPRELTPKGEKKKLNRFMVEGVRVRAEDEKDAILKYLVEHQGYSSEEAKDMQKANGTEYKAQKITKEKEPKQKKLTERRVKRLARRARRDLKADGKYNAEIALDVAKNIISTNPALKAYFTEKGMDETKAAEAFGDYIMSAGKEKKEKEPKEKKEPKKEKAKKTDDDIVGEVTEEAAEKRKERKKKKDAFRAWYKENKKSDELKNAYNENVHELQQMGEKAPSFKTWARGRYKALAESGEVASEVSEAGSKESIKETTQPAGENLKLKEALEKGRSLASSAMEELLNDDHSSYIGDELSSLGYDEATVNEVVSTIAKEQGWTK